MSFTVQKDTVDPFITVLSLGQKTSFIRLARRPWWMAIELLSSYLKNCAPGWSLWGMSIMGAAGGTINTGLRLLLRVAGLRAGVARLLSHPFLETSRPGSMMDTLIDSSSLPLVRPPTNEAWTLLQSPSPFPSSHSTFNSRSLPLSLFLHSFISVFAILFPSLSSLPS